MLLRDCLEHDQSNVLQIANVYMENVFGSFKLSQECSNVCATSDFFTTIYIASIPAMRVRVKSIIIGTGLL